MSKRKTSEEFIRDAKLIHFEKYDYSMVDYVNNRVKIKIICPIHGEFLQKPNNHLNGAGCRKCGRIIFKNKLSKSTEEFIKDAKLIHFDKYDYSKVNYIKAHYHVKIICPIHEEFLQTPHEHLKGSGCKKCSDLNSAKKRAKSTEEFIKDAKLIHFDKYDYSLVNYANSKTKVGIICKKHGLFFQVASHHLSGNGCPICKSSKGEELVYNYLTENDIKFEREKKFKGLGLKRFDFYLPKHNAVIEFDGIQHFKVVDFFGGTKGLERRIQSDKLKDKFCKDNNIKLIRIPYKSIKMISKLIKENINER